MSDIKLSVNDKGDEFVLSYTVEKQELLSRERFGGIIRDVEREVVSALAERIKNEIYNQVMGSVDVNAIANGVSVRIIQTMADQNKGNNY